MGIAQAAVYLIRPTTSYRLLAYGEGAREVGLVAASFALLPIFLAIPLGRMSDRRGAPLLVIGCAVQTVGCLALAFSATTLTIAGASAIIGLGHLALALGSQDVIARESDSRQHDQHFGLLTAGVSLGQLFGPLLAGLLLGASGMPSVGTTTQALLVATGILVLATVCGAVADASRGPAAARTASRRGSVRTIVRTRGVPAGIFASIAVLAAADVFTAYMPVIGAENDIGPRAIGLLLALRAAASIAARLGIGATVRRFGRSRLIAIGAVIAAAALVAMTMTDEVWQLAVLSVAAGIRDGIRTAALDDARCPTRPHKRAVDRIGGAPHRQPDRPGGCPRRRRDRGRQSRRWFGLLAARCVADGVGGRDPATRARQRYRRRRRHRGQQRRGLGFPVSCVRKVSPRERG